ncbi:hypothetical protein F5883DRAFT_431082 [Diaporthe sp. PMI_573]|nr:hypothetical protein F5883DRAFT_431082 [Diaporthaceae sp. PMI_573]
MSFGGFDLCQFPSGTPPDGEQSNFVNPSTLAATTWGIAISMTAWALVFTLARIYVNFRKLRASDYFVIIAMILGITYAGICIALRRWARHLWDLPVCWVTGEYMKLLFIQAMIYAATTYFAKSSILLLYLQFFSVHRNTRIAIWIGLISVGVLYWAAFPIEAPFMTPSKGQTWGELALSGKPDKMYYWGIVQGPLSVIIDIYIFVVPIPVLLTLNMSSGRRTGLMLVFATASLAVVASIVGLVYRVKLYQGGDTSWLNSTTLLCILIENNIAIVVSCMPAFSLFVRAHVAQTALVKSLRTTFFGNSSGSGANSKPSGQNSGGQAVVTFGQGNNRAKRRPDQYQELTEDTLLSRDDSSPLRPKNDGQSTTAITSIPMATYPQSMSRM